MRYKVIIRHFDPAKSWPIGCREITRRGLTLAKAWRLVERAARRGIKLHGGEIARANWGARGGRFPFAYHAASITLDQWGRK